jgi:hypothetical protein
MNLKYLKVQHCFLESTTESHTFAITITGSKSSSLLCHIFVNSLVSYAGWCPVQHFSLYCYLLSWFQHELIFKFSTNVCCQMNYIVSFSSSIKKSCILLLKYTTTSTPVDAPKRQKREPLHISTQSLRQILIISPLCIIQHVNLSSSVNILMSSSYLKLCF